MLSKVEDLLEEGESLQETVHPSRLNRAYLLWYFVGALVALLAGGLFYAASTQLIPPQPWWVYAGVFVLGLLLATVGELRRSFVMYHFTDRKVVKETGILNKSMDTVHYDRVTETVLHETFWQRVFGLGDLYINTAGTDTTEVALHGLKHPERYKVEIGGRAMGNAGDDGTGTQRQGHDEDRFTHDWFEAELGRIERKRTALKQRYRNGEVGEDEYARQIYLLRGAEDEVLHLLDILEHDVDVSDAGEGEEA